tara:strand:- start:523 stop:1794 length:1272 start_codon:yes stop_codon:yes gene_type:complete
MIINQDRIKAIYCSVKMNNWDQFCGFIKETYDNLKSCDEGNVASYIPKLATADPNLFGISVVSYTGEEYHIGDTSTSFCVQSCVKPLLYMLALEEKGSEYVAKHIGREPSGQRFNSLMFNSEKLPYNPLINAGAIMSTSLIKSEEKRDIRYDHIHKSWRTIISGDSDCIGFDNSVFLSEKDSASRNIALSYLMEENSVFPNGTNIENTLDLYFQSCSMTMTTKYLARFAAVMANSGLDLHTGERRISASVLKDTLCVMYSSGMYDYSGRWSTDIGIPAKSGVAGAVFAVIPNVCGICVFSPPLDEMGNSVRAVRFFTELSRRFSIHIFETFIQGLDKKVRLTSVHDEKVANLYKACKEGDVATLTSILNEEDIDVNVSDYDGRTPLHIARAERNTECVNILIEHGAKPNAEDRWGNKAISDND